VVREVREETSVDAEFVTIVAFRHLLNYRHGVTLSHPLPCIALLHQFDLCMH